MTRQEAIKAVQDELDYLENAEGPGVPLFCITDTQDTIICMFNDPRYSTIEFEYDGSLEE